MRRIAVLVLLLAVCTRLDAQVTGRVLDSRNHPLPAAFVSLHDSAGVRLAGALSDSAGAFRLPSNSAARRVRIQLIGYATFSEMLPLSQAVGDVHLELAPIAIEGVAVNAQSACGSASDSAEQIVRLWDAASTALSLTEWTQQESDFGFVLHQYQQRNDSRSVRTLRMADVTDTVVRMEPFKSESVQRASSTGFVEQDGAGAYTYWAPSIPILLSPWFRETHCYAVAHDHDRIGLRFRPQKNQGTTDIRGVLWFMRGPLPQLAALEFDYVGGAQGAAPPSARGVAEFERLPTGHSIIRKWSITAYTTLKVAAAMPVAISDESGGEVLQVLPREILRRPANALVQPTTLQVKTLALADTLALQGDVAAIARMLPTHNAQNADTLMRRALVALRLAALGNKQLYDTARSAFADLAMLSKDLAWADYGAALIDDQRAQQPGFFVLWQGMRRAVGHSREAAGAQHLRRALATDRKFLPALVQFAQGALDSYTDDAANEALVAIDAAGATQTPLSSAYAVELELARDSLARARTRADQLLSEVRNAPSVEYARAQVAFRAGDDTQGWALYQRAARSRDLHTQVQMQRDVAVLFEPDEALPADSALISFWTYRAALAGVSVSERVQQHFQRLHEARKRYRRVSRVSASTSSAVVQHELAQDRDLDMRGVVYVRHGEPTVIVREIDEGTKETWTYGKNTGVASVDDMIEGNGIESFYFVLPEARPDWVLSNPLACDEDAALSQFRGSMAATERKAYLDCRGGLGADAFNLNRYRQGVVAALKREPLVRPKKDLQFYFSLQTLRELHAASPLAVVVIAVPFASLHAREDHGHFIYQFRATVSVADTSARWAVQKDTTLVDELAARPAAKALRRVILEVPARAGSWVDYRVRVVDLNEPDAAHVYAAARPFQAFPQGQFAIGDILFTRAVDAHSAWLRGDLDLDLIPVQRFENGSFGLFFELYNVQPHGSYHVGIQVGEKTHGIFHARKSTGLGYQEEMPADGDRVPLFKSIKLDLPRGHYVLQLTVTDPAGRKVVQERELEIAP